MATSPRPRMYGKVNDTISDEEIEEKLSRKSNSDEDSELRSKISESRLSSGRRRAGAVSSANHYDRIRKIRNFRVSLNKAVSVGLDIEGASAILKQPEYIACSVNYEDSETHSSIPKLPPLLLACKKGHLEMVRVLLQCRRKSIRIDIEYKSETPLSVAAEKGFTEIVKLLLSHGANVNYQSIRQVRYTKSTSKYRSPLYQAASNGHYETAALLLQNKANVNHGFGINSPLMAAARKGHVKLVKLLLDSGAEVHPKPALALCPLAYACKGGHTECARLLMKFGSDVDHDSGSGTPLMCAAENGHTECAKLLLKNGADVNKANTRASYRRDYDHVPPLILASKNGHTEVIKLLLNKDADVNIQSLLGTPLDFAEGEGHHEIVKLLINHRAKPPKILDCDEEDGYTRVKEFEDLKHLAAVERAMKKKSTLYHTLAQGVLVGPARSGKSSLMQRLTGEMPSTTLPSTGVAEQVVQVGVKKSHTIALSVQDSIWFKLLYDEETIRSMIILSDQHNISQQHPFENIETNQLHSVDTKAAKPPSAVADETQPKSVSVPLSSESQTLTTELHVNFETNNDGKENICNLPEGYAPPITVLKNALHQKDLEAVREHFENSWSLYLTDTGGQMEFQELLPLLVSGPSIFFIIFRLNQDLNQRFTIEYHLPDGGRSEPYQSTLTVEDAIFQTLASIASMGTFIYKGPQMESVPLTPKVFIVGTHKDKLEPATAESHIKKIDQYLQSVIKSTSHYRENVVEFADRNQLIFTVNNLSKDMSDFQKIRNAVERVIRRSQYQISFPSHWLIFSLVLRQEMITDSIISYDQCFAIAQDCGIADHEELDHALWFLHTKIGLIRHFLTPSLRNIVIRHPQILFDMVTKLIVNTFTFENVSDHCMTEFKEKGIFNFKDFIQIEREQRLSLLPPKQLLELLEHLSIVAPFQEGIQKKYFIPCVLSHSEESGLSQASDIPPLLIVFKCGYCPKGLPGALITYLLTNEMSANFKWELMTDQIFRDHVTFGVSPYDTITLKIHPKYLEMIHSCLITSSRTQKIEEVCNKTRILIEKGIKKVSADMNLTSYAKHSLSFYCQNLKCSPHEAHPASMIAKDENGTFCNLWCKNSGKTVQSRLPNGYSVWYGKEIEANFNEGTTSILGGLLRKLKGLFTSLYLVTTGTSSSVETTTTTTAEVADDILEDEPSSITEQRIQRLKGPEDVSSASTSVTHAMAASLHIKQTPVLRQAFHILLPLASEWQSIGVLLGIPQEDLRIIQLDNPHSTRNCLSNMLNKWLNHHDPLPTWSALAEAVETIDPSLADIIRKRYLTPS